MGRTIEMVVEVTGYERPRLLASSTHMASMDLHGSATFEPCAEGTTMRWSWELAPRGILALMGPLVAYMGRRQEQRIWAALKQLLEEQTD